MATQRLRAISADFI